MKKSIIIILFLGVIMCSGQDPDVECYSIGYVDGLEVDYQAQIDSLQLLVNSLGDVSEVDIIADTFSFNLVDDRLKITIKKEGHKVWYTLIDGNKRINADYINYERSIMLMDSTYTVGSLYIKSP